MRFLDGGQLPSTDAPTHLLLSDTRMALIQLEWIKQKADIDGILLEAILFRLTQLMK